MESNIALTEEDQGAEAAPVIFEASPYGVVIDRNSTNSGSYVFTLNNCNNITFRTAASEQYTGVSQNYMKVTGAYSGIYLDSSDNCTFNQLEIHSNLYNGVYALCSPGARRTASRRRNTRNRRTVFPPAREIPARIMRSPCSGT